MFNALNIAFKVFIIKSCITCYVRTKKPLQAFEIKLPLAVLRFVDILPYLIRAYLNFRDLTS